MSKISIGCLLAALAVTAPSFAAQTNWLQTYMNAGHTSYNSHETTLTTANVSGLTFLWGQSVAGGVTAFALDAGVIYAQGQGSSSVPNLAAIDATTGTTLWTITTGNDGFGENSVATGGSLVFAGCHVGSGSTAAGAVCAYRRSNGHLVWQYSDPCNCLPASAVGAPLVYSGGVVYFGYVFGGAGGSNFIVAVSATSGDVLWTFGTGLTNTLGSAAPVVGNGMIYFTCGGMIGGSNSFSGVCAVSLSNQTLAWAANFGTGSMGLTLNGNALYVNAGSVNEIAALNATTGATLWTVTANSSAFPVSLANNVIYATGSDGFVHALHAHNGSAIWSLNLASQSSVSLANGVLYDDQQGSNNPETVAYAASNGALLWSSPLPGSTLHPPPIVANGILYITNGSCGNVCAYGLTGG